MSQPNTPERVANRQLAWERIEAALDFAMDLDELSLESFQAIRATLRGALRLEDHGADEAAWEAFVAERGRAI